MATAPRRLLLPLLAVVLSASCVGVAVAEGQTYWPRYRLNLLTLVGNLPVCALGNRFYYNSTAGESPDQVFGLISCFADRNWTQCRMRGAYDSCLLRYSNNSFVSVADLSVAFYSWDYTKVDYPASMNSTRWDLLTQLTVEAARSPLRLANGSVSYAASSPSPTTIHAPPLATGRTRSWKQLVTGVFAGVVVVFIISSSLLICFLLRCRRRNHMARQVDTFDDDDPLEDDFEKGTGPKRFRYSDLAAATSNFSDGKKLGEGGFGSIYKGFLKELKVEVAIKRVSKTSKQWRKEYISEVKIISRLRDRNLVQLIGWCHGDGELLLVYDLMPHGSLDTHLYSSNTILSWPLSNIMLDASFCAKLCDFGLARLVDHGRGPYTTGLAGTVGYMDPECMVTGRTSTESDVYSFGGVMLEIASGKRSTVARGREDVIHLVQWVWNSWGSGRTLELADAQLNLEFNDQEMECVMVVGLWCAHPDRSLRPSIKQAVSVLCFEAPLPSLPAKMPVTTFTTAIDSSLLCASQLTGGT
ncbi:hypothetical protein VPH35_071518 [Triticum aestivum]